VQLQRLVAPAARPTLVQPDHGGNDLRSAYATGPPQAGDRHVRRASPGR
jgi:hypothetical protein